MDVKKICAEAVQYRFAAVCIPPSLVTSARKEMEIAHSPLVATVIGFPFGYAVPKAKLAETEQALIDGADELDMVINLSALRNGDWAYLEKEITGITRMIHTQGKVVKVIIESGILTDDEIIHCCDICGKTGVDFVKTSTGYAEKGATLEAVQLMRAHLPEGVKIKASGGIRSYAFARQLIDAGADRLGCSASVEIVKGEIAGSGY